MIDPFAFVMLIVFAGAGIGVSVVRAKRIVLGENRINKPSIIRASCTI